MTRPCGIALVIALMTSGTVGAQEQQSPLPANGFDLFRGVLGFYGFQPVTDPATIRRSDYNRTCVILIGRPGSDRISRLAMQTLEAGGTVLIAVNTPGPLGEYLPGYPDVEVLPRRVVNASRNYRNQPQYPLIQPAPRAAGFLPFGLPPEPHLELFRSDEQLVAHLPAELRIGRRTRSVLVPLATLPPHSSVAMDNTTSAPRGDNPLIAAGASGPATNPYRCLILTCPEVFSNRLLVGTSQEGGDTQNLEFAARVAKFLKPTGVERPNCLFVDAGIPVGDFNRIGLYELGEPPPVPPLPSPFDPAVQAKLTGVANAAIEKLQADDRLNRELTGGTRRYARVMQGLAGAIAVLATGWMLRRIWTARHLPDRPPVPTDTGRVAGSGPPGSFTRRREELLQSGDYTRPVREYLDDLFTRQGLPADEYRRPRSLPPVAVAGGDARAIRSNLRILWEAAYGPGVVTYSRWKELEPMIAAVQRAAGDGRWRFAAGGAG